MDGEAQLAASRGRMDLPVCPLNCTTIYLKQADCSVLPMHIIEAEENELCLRQ